MVVIFSKRFISIYKKLYKTKKIKIAKKSIRSKICYIFNFSKQMSVSEFLEFGDC